MNYLTWLLFQIVFLTFSSNLDQKPPDFFQPMPEIPSLEIIEKFKPKTEIKPYEKLKQDNIISDEILERSTLNNKDNEPNEIISEDEEIREKNKEDKERKELSSPKENRPASFSPPPDIISKVPLGKFLNPKPDSLVSGKITISFEVEGATSVEFYLRVPSSLVPTYLGQGQLTDQDKVWTYLWDTTNTPNGYYFILPKVTSEFGDYWANKIQVMVANEVLKTEQELKKIEEIKEKVAQKTQELKIEEDQIHKKESKIQEKVEEVVEELKKETLPKIQDEIKEKIEVKTKELKETSQKAIKDLVSPTLPKEEKEEIKKAISETVDKTAKDILNVALPESKTEIETKTNQLRERILQTISEAEKLAEEKILLEEQKRKELARDSDLDNIPDHEELRLGSNPLIADTDSDGFLDGDEMKLGFDLLNPSPASKIKYQDPRKVDLEPSPDLTIEKIETITIPEKQAIGIKISGKALPHSFVTLYIFSLPTIVITKADEFGRWEYILDKALADGQHTVFATVTNNLGQIQKKSQAVEFVKHGSELVRLFGQQEKSPASLIDNLQRNFLILVVALIVFGIGVAFIVIGIALKRKE